MIEHNKGDLVTGNTGSVYEVLGISRDVTSSKFMYVVRNLNTNHFKYKNIEALSPNQIQSKLGKRSYSIGV